MRTILLVIVTAASAALGICIAITGSMVMGVFSQLHNHSGIGAVAGDISISTVILAALLGGATGFLLMRLFLPVRPRQ